MVRIMDIDVAVDDFINYCTVSVTLSPTQRVLRNVLKFIPFKYFTKYNIALTEIY